MTLAVFPLMLAAATLATHLTDRWVYVSSRFEDDSQFESLSNVVTTASRGGLNGVLLACGVDNSMLWTDDRRARLARAKTLCDRLNIEIIPLVWSVGYGSPLHYDPSFAEGIPVKDIRYVAQGGKAVFDGNGSNMLANAGFETASAGRQPAVNWRCDRPGDISFRDTETVHSGRASVRFEPKKDTAHKYAQARMTQDVAVRPCAMYRLSFWLKTEDFDDSRKAFVWQIKVPGKRNTHATGNRGRNAPQREDWRQHQLVFVSGETNSITVLIGSTGQGGGRFWIDDVRLEEIGHRQVVRRPGCPMCVRSLATDRVYAEGKDYLPFSTSTNASPRDLVLTLPSGSAIHDGEALAVSAFSPARPWGNQTVCCMSNPGLYEYFKVSAAAVNAALHPKKWLLSMDEIRAGGTCGLCRARKTDMAHILGDCVTRQRDIIRALVPDAVVYVWHDMFDPAFNAHDDYFLARGTFDRSWACCPRDVVIAVWGGEKKVASLAAMSERGFSVLAATYYDADDLDGCKTWYESAKALPNCRGIMYTTWKNRYGLLPGFCDLIRE